MAGARSMAVGAIDSHSHPPLSSMISFRVNTAFRKPMMTARKPMTTELSSSFVNTCNIRLRCRRSPVPRRKQQSKKRNMGLAIVNEVAGQYEEGFEDVDTQIINYFTYKAVRTVLHQLYEMNPPKYSWFYNFVVSNNPTEGKRFLRHLGKEKQDLAERVMVTRLHLYGKWIKKLDHAKMYERISEENLALMRERLMETVIWPSDDTNTEKIG